MPQIELSDAEHEEYQKWRKHLDQHDHASSSPHRKQAMAIVREEAYWAAGLGLIPIPLVDIAALAAVESRMINRIGAVYGKTYSGPYVNNLVVSLLAGMGSTVVGGQYVTQLLKLVPGLGSIAGAVSVSVTVLPVHFAIGAWLIDALESGPDAEPVIERFAGYVRRTVAGEPTPHMAS